MRLIAIDPGTHCGWATWDGSHVQSGVEVFKTKRGQSPGIRLYNFGAWLSRVCQHIRPHIVIYEEPFLRGGAASDFLRELVGMLKAQVAAAEAEYTSVAVKTLKKWATGSGNASKDKMCFHARLMWADCYEPAAPLDDNEADALLILAWAREQFKGGEDESNTP